MSDEHNQSVISAFAEVLSIEDDIRLAQVELDEAEKRIQPLIQNGKIRLADAWNKLAAIMAETGEYELILNQASPQAF